MGPHFDQADKRIGRNRLPGGYVAVLDDASLLSKIILELHGYASAGAGVNPPPKGVLFRRVTAGEREAIGRLLIDHFGPSELLERAAMFGIDESYHYVIDSRGIAHAWNRHADPTAERQQGQIPIELADLRQIPEIIRQRHIVEFREVKGTPRLVYEHVTEAGVLVLVMEIQRARRWIALKTLFRRK